MVVYPPTPFFKMSEEKQEKQREPFFKNKRQWVIFLVYVGVIYLVMMFFIFMKLKYDHPEYFSKEEALKKYLRDNNISEDEYYESINQPTNQSLYSSFSSSLNSSESSSS